MWGFVIGQFRGHLWTFSAVPDAAWTDRWTDSSFSAAVNSGDHRQLLEIRCLGVSSLFMSSPACEHE